MIAQPFIIFSDCQSPAAARCCKRSQVAPTPTHPHSSLSLPRVRHERTKWGTDVDDEEGIWMGGRFNGRTDRCMYGRETNTRWGVGAIREGAGSPRLCTASDNARPLARAYRVRWFAFATAWRVLEVSNLRNTLHSPLPLPSPPSLLLCFFSSRKPDWVLSYLDWSRSFTPSRQSAKRAYIFPGPSCVR